MLPPNYTGKNLPVNNEMIPFARLRSIFNKKCVTTKRLGISRIPKRLMLTFGVLQWETGTKSCLMTFRRIVGIIWFLGWFQEVERSRQWILIRNVRFFYFIRALILMITEISTWNISIAGVCLWWWNSYDQKQTVKLYNIY